jgi:hypothetical protein
MRLLTSLGYNQVDQQSFSKDYSEEMAQEDLDQALGYEGMRVGRSSKL